MRYCPVCKEKSDEFVEFGYVPRKDAMCPKCKGLERDRFNILFLERELNIKSNRDKKILHIAPERQLRKFLQSIFKEGYLSADLNNPHAMVKMDLTDIKYSDEYFDAIYCSHVLEHIIDDKKAMKELYRVLKKDGWAVLNVPQKTGSTYEDFSITDPKERLKHFGQEDHVRIYGDDYIDRLKSVGFAVKEVEVQNICSDEEIENMALTKASGKIHFCTKSKSELV